MATRKQPERKQRRPRASRPARPPATDAPRNLGALLLDGQDPTTLARRITEMARALLRAEAAALYRIDPAAGDLHEIAASGDLGADAGRARVVPSGTGLAALALAERRIMTSPDLLADPRLTFTPEFRARIERSPYRVALVAPLVVEGRAIGCLGLGARRGRVFTDAEIDLVRQLAGLAAIVLDGVETRRALERRVAESEARRGVAEALREVGQALARERDPDAVGRLITDSLRRLLHVRSAAVYQLRPETGELVARAVSGEPDTFEWNTRFPARAGIVGAALRHGRPVASPDAIEDPGIEYPPDMRRVVAASPYRALLGVPLRIHDRAIGALAIAAVRGRIFTDEEVALAAAFADQAAVALENSRLFALETSRRRTLEVLAEIEREVAAELSPDRLLALIVERASALFQTNGSIFLLEGDALVLRAASRRKTPLPTRLALGEGFVGRCAQTSAGILINDYANWPGAMPEFVAQGVQRAMAQPLRLGEAVAGVIAMARRGPEAPIFTEEEFAALARFAASAGIALRNASLLEAAQRGRRSAEVVAELERALTESLDPGTVAQRTAESVRTLLGARNAALFRLTAGGDLVVLAVDGDTAPTLGPGTVFPAGAGVAGLAVRERRPITSSDLLADPRLTIPPDLRERIERIGYRAVVTVPLEVADGLVGALSAGDGLGRVFTDDEVRLMQALGAGAALALENARLHAETEQRRREAEILAEVARTVNESLDLDTILQRVAESARELCAGDMARIALRDPEADAMVFRYWANARHPDYPSIRIRAGQGAGGLVLATGHSFRTDHYLADTRLSKEFWQVVEVEGVVAELVVPIRIGDRIEGLLYVDNRTLTPFTDHHEDVLERLAAQAAVAIHNAHLFTESATGRRRAEALAEVGRAVTASLDAQQVAELIVDRACALLGSQRAAVALATPGDDARPLRFVANRGFSGEFADLHPRHPRDGTTIRAIHERRPVATADILHDPAIELSPATRAVVEREGYRAVLSVPMLAGGRALGAVMTYRDEPGPFTREEVALLQAFADQAALALENARLFGEAERRRREAEVLADLARAINTSLDLDGVLQAVAEGAREVCACDVAYVGLRNPDGTVVWRHRVGARWEGYESFVLEPGKGIAGRVLETGRPFRTDDYEHDPRISKDYLAAARAEGLVTLLVVPVLIERKIEGLVGVFNRARRPFTDRDEAALQRLADHAATAIRNARLFGETERARRETEFLAEIERAIGASLDLDTVLQRIADGAKDLLGADHASIGLREGDAVAIRHNVGSRPPGGPGPRIEAGRGLGGQVILTGRPMRTADWARDPRFGKESAEAVRQEGIAASMAAPIRTEHGVGGLLYVHQRTARVFTDHDEALLLRLADQAAVAIGNAQLFARHRESERRYRSLFETANDPIATFALDGTITGVNPAAERVLGRGQEEVVGHHYGEFLTGASRALMAERTRRALEGERVPPTVEVNILRKDGGLVLAEGQMSVLRDPQGQTTGWQVIYRDVTERRRAEEALRASEERYRSLVEGSIQGVYIHQDFVLKFVNRALARIFGYDEPADLVGGNLARLLAPHEVPRLQGYAAARLKGEPTPARYEVEGVRKDGTAIWVEVLPTVITWEGAPAILTTLHDITEQKRAEEALRQSREALIQAQKMEAVGRLAGGIAHDFNNLLTVITGRSDLLLRRLGPEDPARRDVELVKRTADRAAALTQQLLAFSRKQMLQPRVLDLNVTVDGMARLLHRLIGENIELATVLEPRLDPVCVDPAQIEQVLLNLVVNARDAMPEGGRLTITTANVTINEAFVAENRGAREGAHVLLSVRDTGHGMSPDVQAHIFEPFFTTKGVGKGTGLGLATVYGIVKQHDGYITVQSAPWEGTTVRVYLPRAEGAPAEAAAPPGVPATLAAGSETVLLVEDQDDLRDFAREVLAMAGYTVLEAAEPERAIALATGHPGPIDLLLTDVVMPQMSGRALAERLAPSRPGMKILYMTGYTDEAIVHHGVLDPGTLLLTKPFTPDVLTRRVQAVLKGTV